MSISFFMFSRRKKEQQNILNNYQAAKSSYFDFGRISLFFAHIDKSQAHQIIDESTLNDLDFEELFSYIDRTISVVGQQYLYAILRIIPKDKEACKSYESIIAQLEHKTTLKSKAILALHELSNPGAYSIQRLIFDKANNRPSWFWVIPLLSALSFLAIGLSFFFPVVLLFALPVFITNFIMHFWNKSNLLGYANTIPYLVKLVQVTQKLQDLGLDNGHKSDVGMAINSLKNVATTKYFLYDQASTSNSELAQLGGYVIELLKGIFLLEPIIFFHLINKIQSKSADIETLFIAVGRIDAAISIASLRSTVLHYAIPEFLEGELTYSVSGLYHPLIAEPVANDVDIINGKSMLISGSNMSGKTTFIRTIGVNALLAQTINTSCSKKYVAPRFSLYSAINISDDLLDETSYYYEEVRTMKRLVKESDASSLNLFLLDELFKGTNTIERIASGKAVLSYLQRNKNLVFASTHDLELTEFLSQTYDYFHFSEQVDAAKLKFDYKIKPGRLEHTNAIRILEINNFPKEITLEATSLAKQIQEQKRGSFS